MMALKLGEPRRVFEIEPAYHPIPANELGGLPHLIVGDGG